MEMHEARIAEPEEGEKLISKLLPLSGHGSRKMRPSRGKAMIKKTPSLKNAFILSVIFRSIGGDV